VSDELIEELERIIARWDEMRAASKMDCRPAIYIAWHAPPHTAIADCDREPCGLAAQIAAVRLHLERRGESACSRA